MHSSSAYLMKRAGFLLALTFLSGCASVSERPDWVNGKSAAYPAADFLTGRGLADTLPLAEERARADVAKTFSVRVDVLTDDRTRVTQSQAEVAGEMLGDMRREARTEHRMQSSTNETVRGMRIAESWQEPESRQHHALAVLPRAQAAAALRQDIAAFDQAIAKAITRAQTVTDPLDRAGAAARAYTIAEAREEVQKTLRVVDITGQGVPSTLSAARLKADADALLERIRVQTEVARGDVEFAERLSGALEQSGFTLAGKGTGLPADFVLTARLSVEKPAARDGWNWRRGTIDLVLSEATGEKVRGTRQWTLKVAGQTDENADVRLMQEVEKTLNAEIRDTLLRFSAP